MTNLLGGFFAIFFMIHHIIMDKHGQCLKASELIDACVNGLREEEKASRGVVTGEGLPNDQDLAVTFVRDDGQFDINVGRPFYFEFERELLGPTPETSENYDNVGPEGTSVEFEKDDHCTIEMISMGQTGQSVMDSALSCSGWKATQSSHEEDLGDVISEASCSSSAHPQHVRCNRMTRRFLSSETIASMAQYDYKEKSDFQLCHEQQSNNFSIANKRQRESESESRAQSSQSFPYNPFRQDDVSRRYSGNCERARLSTPASVLHEIDIAVSLAQSRFNTSEKVSISRSTESSSLSSPGFSSFSQPQDSTIAISDGSRNRKNFFDAVTESKGGISPHTSSMVATRNEFFHGNVVKQNCNFNTPVDASSDAIVRSCYRTAEGAQNHSASGAFCQRRYSTNDQVLSESTSRTSQLRPDFQPKIDSEYDDKKNISFARDTPVPSSLRSLQSGQTSSWSKTEERRCAEKYVRSGGTANLVKGYCADVRDSISDNQPVNLCLQQGKNAGDRITAEKTRQSVRVNKTSEIVKCNRPYVQRQRPYFNQKRRTKSQCLPRGTSYDSFSNVHAKLTGVGSFKSTDSYPDMGIDNTSALENFKEASFSGSQSSSADANIGSLFLSSDIPHMMVQDDMKTYAVLSGRCSDDIQNTQALPSSGSTQHQQGLYPQTRHSHSIINYVGHHGHSPEVHSSDLSPSPPVRDQRNVSSASMTVGMMQQSKPYPNVIVAHRPHMHTMNQQHQDDRRTREAFQRSFDSPANLFDTLDKQQFNQQQLQSTMPLVHHTGTSSFAPIQLSPQQQQQHQQSSQYLIKQQQRRDFFENISSHSGLVTPGSMTHYSGSLQVSQSPHGTYLKPPPIDLNELSDEERERVRVKRERNRVAAAKCRNRRRELLERLEKEAEQLEREQELLRENVRRLRVQKLQLGNMLEEHEPTCHKNVVEEEKKPLANNEGEAKASDQSTGTSSIGQENTDSPLKHTSSPLHVTTQA